MAEAIDHTHPQNKKQKHLEYFGFSLNVQYDWKYQINFRAPQMQC